MLGGSVTTSVGSDDSWHSGRVLRTAATSVRWPCSSWKVRLRCRIKILRNFTKFTKRIGLSHLHPQFGDWDVANLQSMRLVDVKWVRDN